MLKLFKTAFLLPSVDVKPNFFLSLKPVCKTDPKLTDFTTTDDLQQQVVRNISTVMMLVLTLITSPSLYVTDVAASVNVNKSH